ncbi:NAD(P)-binding domain-containing protein [Pseudactinotalea suaedae]|uniref:imine reductase family protein n=1 Tax=Pseudactinotalea suaedae TaxID=1524924 RepID=UPI0012E27537|nr:NAD(P)-binding domain-containing protein [Pseudactinotalea suaedae]
MTSTPVTTTSIAVLGLGPMGAALTRALASGGHRLTAWNRTARTLTEHGLDGGGDVALVGNPEAAVAGAEVVVVCVRDHTASRELVAAVAPLLGDAVLVNVSTGSPEEAAESARQAAALGVRYVTGAVMVPTPMVGTDECLVLYAGAPNDVATATAALAPLGGVADDVGTDHAVPPVLDLAMLDIYFAGMYAFLHATALAGRYGVDPARFLPYAEGVTDTLRGSLPGLSASMTDRTYRTGEARLDMCLAFLEHIVTASAESGVPSALPALIRDASARALRQHPADTDWDVVAEELLSS